MSLVDPHSEHASVLKCMAKFTGSKCKLMRREGTDLYLKSGSRSLETKCNMEKKPGQTGEGRRAKNSDYSLQLRE